MDVLKEGLLKVDPGLLLWTVITFAVLFLILWKAAWKPIVDALDARAEKVRSDIENAEMMRIEAEKQLAQHKEMMDKASAEVASIIAEGKADAERVRSEPSARHSTMLSGSRPRRASGINARNVSPSSGAKRNWPPSPSARSCPSCSVFAAI